MALFGTAGTCSEASWPEKQPVEEAAGHRSYMFGRLLIEWAETLSEVGNN
jgi:hypothetical protein